MARIKIETLTKVGDEIQQLVSELKIDFIEAAIIYAEKNNMEIETLGEVLKKHQTVSQNIQKEAEKLNFLQKEKTHILQFDDNKKEKKNGKV